MLKMTKSLLNRLRLLTGVLLIAMLLPSFAGSASAEDWPTFMHDPARTGYTPDRITLPAGFGGDPADRLELVWKASLGERAHVRAQPIVAGGTVFIGGMDRRLRALDAATGTTRWVYTAGGEIAATATAEGGSVYFSATDGYLYALDGASGALRWRYATKGPLISSPAVVDGIAYVGSLDGGIYAVDTVVGNLVWRYATGGRVIQSPAVKDGVLYIGSEDMHAYALDATTGALRWRTPLAGESMRGGYPVVGGGVVIFTTVPPGVEMTGGLKNWGFRSVDQEIQYYEQYPKRRSMFFLDQATGADLWATGWRIPLPAWYWNMIPPVVAPDNSAWVQSFFRLWRIDLNSGALSLAGSPDEFLLRADEAGMPSMGGGTFYYTIDADVGMYDPAARKKLTLFGDGFQTHMRPLDSLANPYLLRYSGGTGGGGSGIGLNLVVVDGVGYFTAYGWLYAIAPEGWVLRPTPTPAPTYSVHLPAILK